MCRPRVLARASWSIRLKRNLHHSVVGKLHGAAVHDRRTRVLARQIADFLEADATVLDVGCGDGKIASRLQEHLPGLSVEGVDILPRADAHIPVTVFDGKTLPTESKCFDHVLLVDVLHHTSDPMVLLREAARVCRHSVVIKDHRLDRPAARTILRLMDWVGNRPHGVVLPYNYWGMSQWQAGWREIGLTQDRIKTTLGLYPWPANLIFGHGLHFIARLTVPADAR